MDSKPRSTIPVAVTVASDREPVECEGSLTERADGFSLEFCLHTDKFTIEHTRECTRISAHGVMNYTVDLNDGMSSVVLDTEYGKMRADVKTVERTVVKANGELRMVLRYSLSFASSDVCMRAVDITARIEN